MLGSELLKHDSVLSTQVDMLAGVDEKRNLLEALLPSLLSALHVCSVHDSIIRSYSAQLDTAECCRCLLPKL